MKRPLSTLVAAALIAALEVTISSGAEPARKSILGYHADPARSGNFIVQSLTWDRTTFLRLDANFHARVSGHVSSRAGFSG
jgi:hypothetical protein